MDGATQTTPVEVLELLNPRAIKFAALERFENVRSYNRSVGSIEEFVDHDAWASFLVWLDDLGELGDGVFAVDPSGLASEAQRAAWRVFEGEYDALIG